MELWQLDLLRLDFLVCSQLLHTKVLWAGSSWCMKKISWNNTPPMSSTSTSLSGLLIGECGRRSWDMIKLSWTEEEVIGGGHESTLWLYSNKTGKIDVTIISHTFWESDHFEGQHTLRQVKKVTVLLHTQCSDWNYQYKEKAEILWW